eukprot:TRINITY_DN27361_c0_g1_i1.p1 TRINITY_DN27361_c0_g1~~TRINITY_DN27361_c0_g1_i1.p1  ORF type:complete len:1752 (+),score=496.66 TRINITY_DN27361_c0_g1_i1:707-5257(+)
MGAAAEAMASAEAAWAAKAAEAATATSLRRSLQVAASEAAAAQAENAHERMSAIARLRQVESMEESEAAALTRDALRGRVSEMVLARREEAARHVISSLLAGRLESLVLGVFSAWRTAKSLRLQELQAQADAGEAVEVARLRKEVDSLRKDLSMAPSCPNCRNIYMADAIFCRHCGQKRQLQPSPVELELADEVAELRNQITSLSSEAAAAADATAARHLADKAADDEAREAAKLRKKLDLLTTEASAAAEAQELADKSAADEASEVARLRERVKSLSTETAAAADAAADAATAREVATTAATEEARTVAKLTRELESINAEMANATAARELAETASDQEAKELARLREQMKALTSEAAAVADLTTARDVAVESAADEAREAAKLRKQVESLSRQAAAAADAASAREVAAAAAAEEAIAKLKKQVESLKIEATAASAREVTAAAAADEAKEAAHLRRQLESLTDEMFATTAAKELATTNSAEQEQMVAQLRKQVESMHAETAEARGSVQNEIDLMRELCLAKAVASSLTCREAASRKVIARFMANQQDLLLRGVFLAWREANTQDRVEDAEKAEVLAQQLSGQLESLRNEKQAIESKLHNAEKQVASTSAALLEEQRKAASEAKRAESLRSQLEEQPSADAEEASENWSLRCAAAMFSRREAAARHVLTTLIASRLEVLILGVFSAWRDVLEAKAQTASLEKAEQDLAEESRELDRLRQEVREASASEVSAAAQQMADQKAVMEERNKALMQESEGHAARAAQANADLKSSQAEYENLRIDLDASVAEAAELRKELEEARSMIAQSGRTMADEATEAAELRRKLEKTEGATDPKQVRSRVLGKLKDATGDGRLAAALEKRAQTAKVAADLQKMKESHEQLESENAKLKRDLSNVESKKAAATAPEQVRSRVLGKLKDAAGDGSLAAALEKRAQTAKALADSQRLQKSNDALERQVAKLRQELDSKGAPQAAGTCGTENGKIASINPEQVRSRVLGKLENAAKSGTLAAALEKRAQVAKLEGEVRSAMEEAARMKEAALQAEVTAAMLARRETLSTRLLGTVMAAELERLVRGAFSSWRAALCNEAEEELDSQLAKCHRDIEEMRASSEGLQKQAHEEATRAAVAEASLAFLMRREMSLRDNLARMLASQVQQFQLGVFLAWRTCLEQTEQTQDVDENASLIATVALLSRQDQAARKLLVRRMADQLEVFVRGVFVSWAEAVQNASVQNSENRVKKTEHAALMCRAFSYWAEMLLDSREKLLRRAFGALLAALDGKKEESRTAAEEDARASAHEANAIAQEAMVAVKLYARREQATRMAYATLLASQLELLVCGVFQAWRSASRIDDSAMNHGSEPQHTNGVPAESKSWSPGTASRTQNVDVMRNRLSGSEAGLDQVSQRAATLSETATHAVHSSPQPSQPVFQEPVTAGVLERRAPAAEPQTSDAADADSGSCPRCGNVYLPDARFCRKCGHKRQAPGDVPVVLQSPGSPASSSRSLEHAAPEVDTDSNSSFQPEF